MYPLTALQERTTRKDYGTRRGCPFVSSSSFSFSFIQPSSSYLIDNDNDVNDEGTLQGHQEFVKGKEEEVSNVEHC
nr:hypothetical protein [Tanacetum cinerariifolium]